MIRVGNLLKDDPERRARDRARIAEAWEQLNDALEAEQLTPGQMGHILRREPVNVDDEDVDGLVLQLWAALLSRCARDPRGVSADAESLVTYPCRCGPGYGWVYPEDDAGIVRAAPCPDCNARQRALWVDHWAKGCECPECSGPRRHRTPEAAHAEEKAAVVELELDDLR